MDIGNTMNKITTKLTLLIIAMAAVLFSHANSFAEEIPGRNYAKIGDYEIAYREWGTSGTPIMVIHGIPLNTVLWSKVGPLLAEQGYHVFAPGQLGLSHTKGPFDADYSLKGQAELMTRFAEEVIGKPYILYGHDLGGGVAQIMVTDADLKQRNEVSKIIIGNAAVLDMWPVPEAIAAIEAAKSADAKAIFTPEKVGEMVTAFASAGLMEPSKTLSPEIRADLLANYAENDETRQHFINYLKAMDNKWTVEASPKMVMWNRPAMLLWGVNDKFQPPYTSGVALARIMPHARWEYLQGAHFYPLEVPQEVVNAVVAFDQQ
ncbi:alpha/beta hydrolase [Pseudovibrio sp. SPO723]|uniref:alpha/beta fold hydrolase n=1 Tax=Nesiotobacter zosterae TaxID=392721 RepID=UPI0029C41A7C|nr:alpha/beta hydrolase [Pseudovibrio sp. SPO723]MDX5593443.1 alpha/beta hydrolase [Pseudovibrio sp. SPO723]